jgi:hypothetical protein
LEEVVGKVKELQSYMYVPFDEALPQIADVVIEVQESGKIPEYSSGKREYRNNEIGESIPCRNPACNKKGISAGWILREMVRNKQTELETLEVCEGRESMGRGQYRDCQNRFEITVRIAYKEDQ